MIFDGYVNQLPDIDPAETAGVARQPRRGRRHPRQDPRPLPARQAARARPARARSASRPRCQHAVRQHHPARAGAVVPRRRAHRAPHPGVHPLERGDDGRPGEQARRRHRRPPVHVRQLGVAVRDRLQPLLPRQGRRQRRRPRLLPGPRRTRHLRPRVPRGSPDRGRPRPLPPRDRPRRPGPVELPAPAADARLLGVPHGVDGPRPDHRALPRPLQPLPPQPSARRHQRRAGCGRSSATASATSPRRSARSRSPAASSSTTSSSSSTATCSASTARCAATARSSRSSRPCSAAPAGT